MALLERVNHGAADEWRSQVLADGDPSVCDAFHYPALGDAAPMVAMDRHFDPGWWTIKQGADLEAGLQLWDPETQAWLDAERPEFYGGLDPSDCAVVFAGERLASWTEGSELEIPAVPHRVVAPRGQRSRTSFIFELRDHVS